jgi:CBS domain-containing protein
MHAIRHVIRPLRLVTAPPNATVFDVARTMTISRVGAIPIVQDGSVVGIFSERDLMTRVLVEGLDARQTQVREVMTRDVLTASPEDTRSECIRRMRDARCRHLPVLENSVLIAVLSMRDLLRDEIEEQHEEIRGLRAYLHQTPV